MDVQADRARYEADRAKDIAFAGTNGIDAVMKTHQLDALLFPRPTARRSRRKPGYPTVIVPFGTGPECAHAGAARRLQREAGALRRELHGDGVQRATAARRSRYAFEQATKRRVPPPSTP